MKRRLALAAAVAACALPPSVRAATDPPKLVVVISIDQFGADLFAQNRSRFRHGLKRLASGVVYPNAYQAHGQTETCAGHATLLSGRHPRASGIVANQWYDAARGVPVYCTDDGRNVAAASRRANGVGPGLLEGSTFGDWLKTASPASRVVSVAGKDRSAIMLGGHQPDGAFWLNGRTFDTWGPDAEIAGRRLSLLASLNASLSTRPAPPAWDYADPTCRALETDVALDGGQTFRSRLPPEPPSVPAGLPALPKGMAPPPAIDAMTLEAAAALVDGLSLGRGPATDLLAIGLSGVDMVGHAYGTRGPEMCDQLARLDAALGDFLTRLERTGAPMLVVVTADHGGADIPERLAPKGRRLDPRPLLADLNRKVRAKAGVDWDPLRTAGLDVTQLYIVDARGRGLVDAALRTRIADAAIVALGVQADVAGAWTAEHLADAPRESSSPDKLDLRQRMALSYFAGRSGDINLALAPGVTASPALPGLMLQTHGSPYDTNRRIPLLFWWPGARADQRGEPVDVVDLAPTLARITGVTPPEDLPGSALPVRPSKATKR